MHDTRDLAALGVSLAHMYGPRIPSQGVSESWKGQQKNVVRIFNAWVASRAASGASVGLTDWDSLTEVQATDPDLYATFAKYLTNEYTWGSAGGGKTLRGANVVNYTCALLHLAKAKWSTGSAASKLFFTCLDIKSNTEAGQWLRGMKNNIKRITFKRAKEDGTAADKGKVPAYLLHILMMAEAWSKMGQPADAERKFQLICLWLAAGRSSETAWLSFDAMDWDPLLMCVFADLPQDKVGEVKLVAFVAGASAGCCFYTALGDDLVLNGGRDRLYDGSMMAPLFSSLLKREGPAPPSAAASGRSTHPNTAARRAARGWPEWSSSA